MLSMDNNLLVKNGVIYLWFLEMTQWWLKNYWQNISDDQKVTSDEIGKTSYEWPMNYCSQQAMLIYMA